MPNKYCYECKPVTLSTSAQSQLDQFVINGYAPEHILGSYLDFRKGVQDSAYPLTDLWKGVKEADFLTCYCDYITRCKGSDSRLILQSEYGIDNGIVFERFFRSVNSTDHLLIINPHPQFVQSLESISAQITITYTDDRYAEIMSTPENKSKSKSKSKIKVACASISQLENSKYNRVLFFTQNLSTAQIVLAMEQLKPLLVDDKDTIIYLQMPSKHFDSKHSRPVLCDVFRKDFTVNQVIMLDSAATQGNDKKRCIMILRNTSPSSTADVVLQKTKLVEEKGERYLSGSETRRIYYDEFLLGSKTLRAAYDTLGRDTAFTRKREKAVPFVFSREIDCVRVSSMPKGRKEIRPKYTVYDIPNTDQLRRNKDAHGDKVYVHQGPRMSSREQAMAHALEFMFDDPKAFALIYDIVMRTHYCKPISLKSMWYLYRNELEKLREYDNTICEELFRSPYNPDSLMDNLIVGESTYPQVVAAIKECCVQNNINKRQYERILAQISILWDIGVRNMHAKSNPVADSPILRKGNDKTQELRNAMVIGSHGTQTMATLIANLQDNDDDPSLRVGFWIMLLLAVMAGEVCALRWRDLRKVDGQDFYQLNISKKFGPTGTTSLPLVGRWLVRGLPVIRTLENMLLNHKRSARKLLLSQGIGNISIEDCPVIHAPGDPTKPVPTRALNAYVRKMLSSLNISSHFLAVPKLDGTSRSTDITQKQRNFLRSNFEHSMITYAKMNADEIAYMVGRTPVTVMALNYITRKPSLSQKELFLKMRKWENRILCSDASISSVYGELKNNAPIILPECNRLMEMDIVAQHNGEGPMTIDLMSRYGLRANITKLGGSKNE